MVQKTVFAALGVLVLLSYRAGADTPLYVGFLEGPQTTAHDAISASTHVRIAFRKDGVDWKPMDERIAFVPDRAWNANIWKPGASIWETPSPRYFRNSGYPSRVQWTVVFNGRTLGNLTSRNPDRLHWYADIGTHALANRIFPVVRAGAADFFYGSNYKAKVRPLLLISGAGTSAPSQWAPQDWKPSSLSREERRLAIAAFRNKVVSSQRCDAPEQSPVHPVPYSDNAVTIVKSYRDNGGEALFGARLNDPKANCGFFDDETFFDYWFVIDRQRHIHYLDSQMTPIDAADLDHSGRSSWLFFTSRGEDDDGYELFYDDFKKNAQFQWSYH